MTDFDKEFELLKEWLDYRIDWYTEYLLYYEPKNLFRLWEDLGLMDIYPSLEAILSFEEWKNHNMNPTHTITKQNMN